MRDPSSTPRFATESHPHIIDGIACTQRQPTQVQSDVLCSHLLCQSGRNSATQARVLESFTDHFLARRQWTGKACEIDGISYEVRTVDKMELEDKLHEAIEDPKVTVQHSHKKIYMDCVSTYTQTHTYLCCFHQYVYASSLLSHRPHTAGWGNAVEGYPFLLLELFPLTVHSIHSTEAQVHGIMIYYPCFGMAPSFYGGSMDDYLRDSIPIEKDVEGLCDTVNPLKIPNTHRQRLTHRGFLRRRDCPGKSKHASIDRKTHRGSLRHC